MKKSKTGSRPAKAAAAKAPRPYHHGDLRRALIAAAMTLLEREGAEALSFRAVARAAGVSQAAPYNHFSGKEDLLATLAEAGFRTLAASQAETAAQLSEPLARMVGLGLDYIGFAVAHPQLYRLMFGVGVADWHAYPLVSEAKHATFVPTRATLADYLAADTPPEIRERAAIAAWGLVHGLAMLRIDGSLGHGRAADPKLEQGILRLFAGGLMHGAADGGA